MACKGVLVVGIYAGGSHSIHGFIGKSDMCDMSGSCSVMVVLDLEVKTELKTGCKDRYSSKRGIPYQVLLVNSWSRASYVWTQQGQNDCAGKMLSSAGYPNMEILLTGLGNINIA